MLLRSADSFTAAAAPAVFTSSKATTEPARLHSARRVPDAQGTFHSPRNTLALIVFDPCEVPFRSSSTLSQLL